MWNRPNISAHRCQLPRKDLGGGSRVHVKLCYLEVVATLKSDFLNKIINFTARKPRSHDHRDPHRRRAQWTLKQRRRPSEPDIIEAERARSFKVRQVLPKAALLADFGCMKSYYSASVEAGRSVVDGRRMSERPFSRAFCTGPTWAFNDVGGVGADESAVLSREAAD